MELFVQAVIKFLSGLLLVCPLLFLPAGTLQYPSGWLFLGLLFLPMFLAGLILYVKNPEFLRKRLDMKEKEPVQRTVILLSGLEFTVCFALAGLDFRFGWSRFPPWLTVLACIWFLGAYALYAEVLRENVWLSRTVEVQENQSVVDTGLYRIIRHPMYLAAILLFWAIPLVLGSWLAFLVMLPYPLLLVKRIQNEEQVLEAGLRGYREYERKVKYRLLPFLW